jgi:hypothetical protein
MDDWLSLAADAYQSSTSYFDSAYRRQFEESVAHFQGRHAPDSKYHSDLYKHRSKIFRPKSRSMVRKAEAGGASAFFSNVDVVDIEPMNDQDPAQKMSAELMKQLVNFRLTDPNSIKWFVTCIGAIQESKVFGIVCSYQYWKYKQEMVEQAVTDEMGQPYLDDMGQPMVQQVPKIVEDKPCIELLPVENIRFDPGADWTDVVNSSPFFIRKIPMYVQDVRARMYGEEGKTQQKPWKSLEDSRILASMSEYDSLRTARENQRPDPYAESKPIGDFEIVWVHENFIRKDGQEWHYFTLGTSDMLTDAVPLKEVYFTGIRPFVIGTSSIEVHRPVPAGDVEMGGGLQRELNENANARLDNVKLVLNKRWLVKRNTNVDLQSLMRNVPGAVTLTDDIGAVQEVNWPDVTGSSYQEQDRLNLDFDDLLGNFSQSSVMSNRSLNETVGGMQMLGSGANQIQEYSLRTLVETWVEPVLYQLVKLEQLYETDLAILAIAGQKAQLQQKYGIDRVTDQMLDQQMTVRVNVGMGATNPQQKLQKMAMAMDMYGKFAMIPGVDPAELKKTIFGYAGIRGAMSAFKPSEQAGPPPEVQQMVQQMQQAQQEMAKKAQELQQRENELAIKQAQIENSLIKQSAKLQSDKANAEVQLIQKEVAFERQAQAKSAEIQASMQPYAESHERNEKPDSAPVQIILDATGAAQDIGGSIRQVQSANETSTAQTLMAIQAMMESLTIISAQMNKPKTSVMEIRAPSGQVYVGQKVDGGGA